MFDLKTRLKCIPIDNMTIEIDGTIYKSKIAYFKEMGEEQRPNESYPNFHKRCNMKYFPEIKKKVYSQCNSYLMNRYHNDEDFRRKHSDNSKIKYLRKLALI